MSRRTAASSAACATSSDRRPVRLWPALDITLPGGGDAADLVAAALLDFAVAAIDEGDASAPAPAWSVYFQDAGERDRAAAALGSAFPDLRLHTRDVDDENWAARSQ